MNKSKLLLYKTLKSFGPIAVAIVLMFWVTRSNGDYEDGVNAAFAGDYQTAFREFSIAAESGLAMAQYNLGILYFTGQGVSRDYGLAFKWTDAAARQGHLDAQFNLGSLYFEGRGTERDDPRGGEWFGHAARAGHANAAFALANMHRDGERLARDLVQAHAWGSLAVHNGHAEAASLVAEIESSLDAGQLSEARRQFARWRIEAPSTDYPSPR